jgi:hypothetical protein
MAMRQSSDPAPTFAGIWDYPRNPLFDKAAPAMNARWIDYLDSLPWQRRSSQHHGTLDHSGYCAFLRAATLKIESERALEEVSARVRQAGAEPPLDKLKRQLKLAYDYVGANPGEFHGEQTLKAVYQPEKLAAVAAKLQADDVDDDYFITRSPFTTWNRNPAGFLHKLFRQGERVVCFSVFKSQGCCVWQCPGLSGDFSTLDFLATGQANVWFLCNPVDGVWREIERLKTEHNPTGRTRRAEENVTSFRYAVIESDEAPRELWLKALARLPLPIASVIDSGGSSIHALFRVDAENKRHWDDLVRSKFKTPLTRLGADPRAMTAVRLTRLANCFRAEKGKLQRLLYLNQEPDDTPICERPILREE